MRQQARVVSSSPAQTRKRPLSSTVCWTMSRLVVLPVVSVRVLCVIVVMFTVYIEGVEQSARRMKKKTGWGLGTVKLLLLLPYPL